MDSRRWQSPAAAAAAAEAAEEDTGGAGGPSRRPARRGIHRASPYAGGPRRWLPRIPVASRIFPTIPRDRASSDNNQEVHRESLDVIPERQSVEPNTNAAAVGPTIHVSNKFNLLLQGDRNPSHGNGLADIENIINQRHFSRDETERLIEIMRSRTPDLSVEDQIAPGSTAKGFETTPFSTPARLIDWGTPTSNVHGMDSSPIEIAKAFMEAQTSASVHESQKRKFRALSHGVEPDNSTSKVFPKVATDSSVCWPGSVVRGYQNYLTPQSNKGRTLPQPLSRTPYSGSVFRRSIKSSRHSGTYTNSSGQLQLSTPFSVGNKTMVEDKLASTSGSMVRPSSSSGGQINVFGSSRPSSSSGGQINVFGSSTSLFPRDDSAATKSIAFNLQGADGKGNIESRATSGHTSAVDNISRGASVSVHPKSSETAFKILQHLERTIPSPTLKPLDLRQTLTKRNASFATNSQIKRPDFSIGNGHRLSGTNETGSGNLEAANVKKVPPSRPNEGDSSQRIQSSGANTEVPETHTSQELLKSGVTSTSVAEASDKSISKGFSFTFPVPKAPSSLFEPPPTPTLASPPRTLPVTTEDIPKFNFRSSSATNKPVFSFDFTGSFLGADGTDPTFKFRSDRRPERCFDIAGKDAVCF